MSFLLVAIEKRAMCLNGRMALAGVAVSSQSGKLLPGTYNAYRTYAPVEVIAAGGRLLPDASAREAYCASKPTPVAIDAAAMEASAMQGQVFVEAGDRRVLHEFVTDASSFPASFAGHWIPVMAAGASAFLCDGWVMQVGSEAKGLLLLDSSVSDIGSLQLSPIFAPELGFRL